MNSVVNVFFYLNWNGTTDSIFEVYIVILKVALIIFDYVVLFIFIFLIVTFKVMVLILENFVRDRVVSQFITIILIQYSSCVHIHTTRHTRTILLLSFSSSLSHQSYRVAIIGNILIRAFFLSDQNVTTDLILLCVHCYTTSNSYNIWLYIFICLDFAGFTLKSNCLRCLNHSRGHSGKPICYDFTDTIFFMCTYLYYNTYS